MTSRAQLDSLVRLTVQSIDPNATVSMNEYGYDIKFSNNAAVDEYQKTVAYEVMVKHTKIGLL